MIQGCLSFLLSLWSILIELRLNLASLPDVHVPGLVRRLAYPSRPADGTYALPLSDEDKNNLTTLTRLISRLLRKISDAQTLNGPSLGSYPSGLKICFG